MAIGLRLKITGGTQEQYDALHAHMGIDGDPPEGLIFHAGGPIDEGWGVIDSDATPGGCWAHFSNVLMSGYRLLSPGQQVSLEFETGWQDGYDYRAVAVWTGNDRPSTPTPQQPSAAYRSILRLEFDAPTDGDATSPADQPR